jgi:hypothetical protein
MQFWFICILIILRGAFQPLYLYNNKVILDGFISSLLANLYIIPHAVHEYRI